MGRVDYIGGHTIIFISDSGTKWEVPDHPAKQPDNSRRGRWNEDVAVETGRRMRKEERSFLSMCAVSFRNDVLSESNPTPPPALQRAVKLAGGNKKWIIADTARLRVFEDFFRKRASES
jgi:hypothetical protein